MHFTVEMTLDGTAARLPAVSVDSCLCQSPTDFDLVPGTVAPGMICAQCVHAPELLPASES